MSMSMADIAMSMSMADIASLAIAAVSAVMWLGYGVGIIWPRVVAIVRTIRTILDLLILVIKECSSPETCSRAQIVSKLPRLDTSSCQHKVGAIELVQRVLNARLWNVG